MDNIFGFHFDLSFTLKLVSSVGLCAFIGWLTNYLAIKMLFHPHRPIMICGFKLQGIFPKRQEALAKNLSDSIVQELFSYQDIRQAIQSDEFANKIKEKLLACFSDFLKNRIIEIIPMAAMFLTPELVENIIKMLDKEMEKIIPALVETAALAMDKTLNLQTLIQEKIVNLSVPRLEKLLMGIMKKEFRFVELVGAILGGIIGLTQGLIFLL